MQIFLPRLRQVLSVNYLAGLVFIVAMTAIVSIGVNRALETTIRNNVLRDAEAEALQWAAYVTDRVPAIERVVAEGRLSTGQNQVIDEAMLYGAVQAFVVYTPNGQVVLSTAEWGPSPAESAQTVREVAVTGIPAVSIMEMPNRDGTPAIHGIAFVPARDDVGRIFGVIELHVDESDTYAIAMSTFRWLTFALPLLCAILYVIPSTALLYLNARARQSSETVDLLSRLDVLTGVRNRKSLTENAREMFGGRSPGDPQLSVFYIDVDNFKAINDEHGHETGDAYLRHVSAAITENLRASDIVGRMGGDEFVVILPDASETEAVDIAERIRSSVARPMRHKGVTVSGTLSIGVHVAGAQETEEEALNSADLALYHAKAGGRNRVVVYFDDLDMNRKRRKAIELRLKDALASGNITLHYQALHEAGSGKLAGFEALMRLSFEDGTPIPPDEFISVAEDSGLIDQIGEQVLRRAIHAATGWPGHLFLAVNLSPVQFESGHLAETVSEALLAARFAPFRLELEVTERLLLNQDSGIAEQLTALKDIGVSLAMDDFGTGYSSLAYLWEFEFDKIKVDRAFLRGLDVDQDRHLQILEAIVGLGHGMGMSVTLEGVEKPEHLSLLARLGCDLYQGYLFSRPLPESELAMIIAEGVNRGVAELRAGSLTATRRSA